MRPRLMLRGDNIADDVASAIEEFEVEYHSDFKSVSEEAKKFVTAPGDTDPKILALALRAALLSWGAGRRGAPSVSDAYKLETAIDSDDFKSKLVSFAKYFDGKTKFEIDEDGKCKVDGDQKLASEFAKCFHEALSFADKKILIGNTSVTYPMKTLLLLVGAPLAFDSYVREGLRQAGFDGFAATQNPFPNKTTDSGFRKIFGVFFLVYDCWNAYEKQIKEGIKSSSTNYVEVDHMTPSRVFDILFFMKSPILKAEHCKRGWYQKLSFG